LVPALRAGGADVLIDRERFRVGGGLYRQMDDTQDQADRQVLVLSAEYLSSGPCQREMRRAIALDPDFQRHVVLPVRRDDAAVPDEIRTPHALYVDLRDDSRADQWTSLLVECGARLGTTAPEWLSARNEVRRLLLDDRTVNLVVSGDVKWRELIAGLDEPPEFRVPIVDLDNPATVSRRGLLEQMLGALGARSRLVQRRDDLPEFGRIVESLQRSRLALLHFDMVRHRRAAYDVNLFRSLRYLVTDQRKLVLLIQSRSPLSVLRPRDESNSHLDAITVELKGRA
jgi:hypothetical protein